MSHTFNIFNFNYLLAYICTFCGLHPGWFEHHGWFEHLSLSLACSNYRSFTVVNVMPIIWFYIKIQGPVLSTIVPIFTIVSRNVQTLIVSFTIVWFRHATSHWKRLSKTLPTGCRTSEFYQRSYDFFDRKSKIEIHIGLSLLIIQFWRATSRWKRLWKTLPTRCGMSESYDIEIYYEDF